MPSFYPFSDLTGGGAGALDALDGAGLANGDIAFVAIEDNALYDDVALVYVLDADSAAAEAVPDVIAPDANGGNKRWLLACLVSKDLVLRGTLNVTGVATFGANPRIYDGDSHHATIDVPDIGADITITMPGVTATLATTTELHAAATLEAGLNTNLLSLSGQELQLDVQGANEVFAGPTTGVDATPVFRSLAVADIPIMPTGTKAVTGTLTAAEMRGGVFSNLAQAADVILTLDPAFEGGDFGIALVTTVAQYYRIDPNAADAIILDGDPGADGEYVQVASAAKGNFIWFTAVETAVGEFDWFATTISGPWVAE